MVNLSDLMREIVKAHHVKLKQIRTDVPLPDVNLNWKSLLMKASHKIKNLFLNL